jgi:hypothetical protein
MRNGLKKALATTLATAGLAGYITANKIAIGHLEKQGIYQIGIGIEGDREGNIQAQPWLTIFCNPESGEARETIVGILGPGPVPFRYTREPTQAERNWYKEKAINSNK